VQLLASTDRALVIQLSLDVVVDRFPVGGEESVIGGRLAKVSSGGSQWRPSDSSAELTILLGFRKDLDTDSTMLGWHPSIAVEFGRCGTGCSSIKKATDHG